MKAWTRLLAPCAALLVVAACGGGEGAEREAGALDDLPPGWTTLPEPPEVRSGAATAWTGEAALVWGGYEFSGYGDEIVRADGFVFDGATRDWRGMADSPLAARVQPASAWTGRELLIWGGTDIRDEHFFGDGAAYDPSTDAWRELPPAPITGRAPLAVWTGDELLVWGTAVRVDVRPRDGAAYNPVTNDWRTIAEAPIELTDATAVWTGREMIVFGAALHGGNVPETTFAIGAAYDPDRDTWRRLPDSTLSPQASTAAWAGRELIAWDYLNGTAAYDPDQDRWRGLPGAPIDPGECRPQSVRVGDSVLGDHCGLLVAYDAASDRWQDVAGGKFVLWGFELVPAGEVVLLLGRLVEPARQQMLAYRPG